MCGDGICQEGTCLAIGCPCGETSSSCPQDCSIPTPTFTPTPTPTPTPRPTPTPTPAPTFYPPSPTPTPTPVPQEEITVHQAELSRILWKFHRLKVEASSSLSPNVKLSVINFGDLRYSKKKDTYSRTFRIFETPQTITILSSSGAGIVAPVTWK